VDAVSSSDIAAMAAIGYKTAASEPSLAAIEKFGSTWLSQGGNEFYLANSSGSTGPVLQYHGAPVVVGQFGSGWTPVGAEQTTGGYEVAWKNAGADQYGVWNVDSSGNYIANVITAVPGNTAALESIEPSFQQDINGDGFIGPPPSSTVIESAGSTSLTQVGNEYFLDSSGGSGPLLSYRGAPVVAGQWGDYAPIAAEKTATGYDVAWKSASANLDGIWVVDGAGNYLSNVVTAVAGNNFAVEAFETALQQDINGDRTIGVPGMTVLETSGSTWLTQTGSQFELLNSAGSGPTLQYGGSAVVSGEFGSDWAPIGAEATAGGYEVAWKSASADLFGIWNVDSSGKYVSNVLTSVAANNGTLEALEPSFQQDLNGDGVVGKPSAAQIIGPVLSELEGYFAEGATQTGDLVFSGSSGGDSIAAGSQSAPSGLVYNGAPATLFSQQAGTASPIGGTGGAWETLVYSQSHGSSDDLLAPAGGQRLTPTLLADFPVLPFAPSLGAPEGALAMSSDAGRNFATLATSQHS
jgi:hypothetical protein